MKKNYLIQKIAFLTLLLTVSLHTIAQDLTGGGIFILNEGGAGSENASVSFLEPDAITAYSDIFTMVNPDAGPLGDTAQSLSFNGDYAYIVLNISNTIRVVKRETFELVATVSTGLNNPRYMAFHNGTAYVTNWGSGGSATDDYIAILDLGNNTITGTIPVAEGAERILTYNGKLYAAHQGGYGFGDTISVVDPVSNTVETTIPVGDVPNRMAIKDGSLYVLGGGKPMWAASETDGSLVKVDLATNTVVSTTIYEGLHTWNLNIGDDGYFYFTSDAAVYKASLDTPATYTQITTLEEQGAYGIYGMDLIDDKLYVADAGNYVSPGTAYVFNTTGTQLGSYGVGVIPNGFYKAETDLGTPGFAGTQLAVYPNPTTERFFLNTDKNPEVAIFDISGKEVMKTQYTTSGVNVSNLPQGVYMVRISDDASSTVKKLIIK